MGSRSCCQILQEQSPWLSGVSAQRGTSRGRGSPGRARPVVISSLYGPCTLLHLDGSVCVLPLGICQGRSVPLSVWPCVPEKPNLSSLFPVPSPQRQLLGKLCSSSCDSPGTWSFLTQRKPADLTLPRYPALTFRHTCILKEGCFCSFN